MHRPTGEDPELKQIKEELGRLAADIRAAFRKSAPVLKVSLEQMRFAAENAKRSLEVFGAEIKKALENWAEDGDDDGKVETGK
jgi:hypothetical protein